MKCKALKYSELPERTIYLDFSEARNVTFVNAYNAEGHFLATLLAIDENGVFLTEGIPPVIGFPTDKRGRIKLINTDLELVQRKTKRILPLERIE